MPEEKGTTVSSQDMAWTSSPETIRYQLGTEDLIESIEHNLKGERFNATKQIWEKKEARLVNDEGIKTFMTIVSSKLNRNTFLSNLSEDDVLRIAMETRQNVGNLIFLNYGKFEIDKCNFDTVIQAIDHPVICALRRAQGEGERRFLGKTQSTSERIVTSKGSRGSWIPFFGSKSKD